MEGDDDPLVRRALDEGVARELREHGALLPPWLRYPEVPRHAIGWRMGGGESFLWCWWHWAEGQTWEQLVDYFRRYAPVPVAWADWVAAELDRASKADVIEAEEEGDAEDEDPEPGVKRAAALGIVDYEAWRAYRDAEA